MQHNGWTPVPHYSYDEWKANVNGNGWDIDGYYGDQCWDAGELLWRQYGMNFRMPTVAVKDGWINEAYRNLNAGDQFDLIYDKTQIKRGDVVMMGGSDVGHLTYADEDYNGTDYLNCLGQNQYGNTPYSGGGTFFGVTRLGLGDFLGCFRNKEWEETPPVPPVVTTKKKRFPYLIMARYKYGIYK